MRESREVPNRKFSTPVYLRACQLAGIAPTKRQASKWRNGNGIATKFKTAAIIQLGREVHLKAREAEKVASAAHAPAVDPIESLVSRFGIK